MLPPISPGLDADGNVKDEAKVSMQNRGTQGTKGLYGELGRKITRPLAQFNEESSSEDEEIPESSSEHDLGEHTGEQQLESDSSEESKVKNSDEYSGGEEQSEEESAEPDNAEGDDEEENKLQSSPEIHNTGTHVGNTQSNGTDSHDKPLKSNAFHLILGNVNVNKSEENFRNNEEYPIKPKLTS
jgi:hypothetical protein